MVYVFLADGFEEIEGLTTVDALRRAKIDVKTVSVTKDKLINGSHGIHLYADALFEEVDFSDAELLVLPGGLGGGKGANQLFEHEGLKELLIKQNNEGKLIAAICAAPYILGLNGILAGKQATCYPGFEDKLTGAAFIDANAVESGNVITGRGMGASLDFALLIVKRLQGEEAAKSLAERMEYFKTDF
ncbi:MAG: DJ-1/PfpI family protein [Lachnospiraceae bacterium]|nr:DJ-1/PfpI family protein [Lachnospiraceae bacterium]